MLTGAGLFFEYRAIARSRRKDSLFKTSCGCTAQVNKRAVHSKNQACGGELAHRSKDWFLNIRQKPSFLYRE